MLSGSPANKKNRTGENYPRKSDPNSPPAPTGCGVLEKFLLPVKLSFNWLCQVVLFAVHNVQSKCWNKTVISEYLNTCAVLDSVIDDLLDKN